ncbi:MULTISPECIES: hypothetical protein [unclassified Streptomyces]|uniref:hypothetical protein n=1 Tax=unclassified Streptomyces TaxID=2593676 RepID=UPI0035D82181
MTKTSTPTVGRPTLLTPHMIQLIERAARAGKTRPQIAARAGVSLNTLQRWITHGRRAVSDGVQDTGERTFEQLTVRLVKSLRAVKDDSRLHGPLVPGESLARNVPLDRKPLGRPTLLTSAAVEELAGPCAAGDFEEAARLAGADVRTVHRWLSRGHKVHAAGGATTEYELLCGRLHARAAEVRAAGAVPARSTEKAASDTGRTTEKGGEQPARVVLAIDPVRRGEEPVIVIGRRRGSLLERLVGGYSRRKAN